MKTCPECKDVIMYCKCYEESISNDQKTVNKMTDNLSDKPNKYIQLFKWINLKKILTAIFVMFFIYIGGSGMITKHWRSPDKPIIYALSGGSSENKQKVLASIILYPDNKAIYTYNILDEKYFESAYIHLIGTYATKYPFNIWNIYGSGDPSFSSHYLPWFFGFRRYTENIKPILMNQEILNKSIHGSGKQQLPKIGAEFADVYLISDDSIKVEDSWFWRIDDEEYASMMIFAIESQTNMKKAK